MLQKLRQHLPDQFCSCRFRFFSLQRTIVPYGEHCRLDFYHDSVDAHILCRLEQPVGNPRPDVGKVGHGLLHGELSRIELRSPDTKCNQYLVLALVIAAGLEGIEKKLELPSPVDLDLYNASEKDVASLEMLPADLDEALKIAADSDFIKSVVPENTLRSYIENALGK